jgi:hypothetical protein
MGATDHIMLELDKPTIREKNGDSDQVHTASGLGMPISHIGQTTIHSHDRSLILKDILHVPDASKNLLPFISLPMTIMHSLSFTLGTFF